MGFYEIPPSLDREIDELAELIKQRENSEIGETELRAHRVPFGVYEQRTGGSYMARIRCPGGAVTPLQLKTVARLSKRYGSSFVHVTTRQELQIHDVKLSDVVPLLRELRSAGLATRGGGGNTVRNIMASWDSGIAGDEVFDVLPYAVELTNRLIAQSDSWLLPRKYKISFSNSPRDNANATLNDVGFIATRSSDGQKGFKVYVAGGMGRKPSVGHLLHEFIPDTEVYRVTEAVKKVFAKHGNRKNKHSARLRFLWRSLGRERFVETYTREYELLEREVLNVRNDELSVGAQGRLPELSPIHRRGPQFGEWERRYVLPQKQAGFFCVTVPLLLGKIDAEHLESFAEFAAHFGEDSVRATMTQNLTIRHVPRDLLGNAFEASRSWSELIGEPRLAGDCITCAGAGTCRLGICLPRGAALAIRKTALERELELDALGNFKLNLSGCSNTCGQHVAADLGFFGKAKRKGEKLYPAYTVVAGAVVEDGKTRMARELGTVSARDIPRFVADCLERYIEDRDGECTLAQYLDTGGEAVIKKIIDKYRDIPDFDDDKNYYYDWGAEEPFSLAGRGTGECSAGLFDLIEVDLEQIRKLRLELESAGKDGENGDLVYRLALASSRMLLITRAVEPKSEKEVFTLFRKHFVDTDLIPMGAVPILELAERGDADKLLSYSSEVLELSHKVEELYNTMDNSLRFAGVNPGEASGAETGSEDVDKNTPHVSKDFRGVPCPMNYVKTKLELSRMQSGTVLEVLLDDGRPIENVPRSAKAEGHEIVGQTRKDDHWSVYIRKA